MVSMKRKRILVCVVVAVCMLGLTVFPAVAGASGQQKPNGAAKGGAAKGSNLNEAKPDAQINVDLDEKALEKDPAAKARVEALKKGTPQELLPDALKEKKETPSKSPDVKGGAGSGNWAPFSQSNAVNPVYNGGYDIQTGANNNRIDQDGNQHTIIGARQTSAIWQYGPNPWDQTVVTCNNLLYCKYTEGSWSKPMDISSINTAARESAGLVGMNVDAEGNLHVVYTKGNLTALTDLSGSYYLQFVNENLYYRYRDPAGKWSSPKRLTSFTGNQSIPASAFLLRNGKIYVVGYQDNFSYTQNATLLPIDRESHTVNVFALDGIQNSWKKSTLATYQFTCDTWGGWQWGQIDPGCVAPQGWPTLDALDVSNQKGDAAAAYPVVKKSPSNPPVLKEDAQYLMAANRSKDKWSAAAQITTANQNEQWSSQFVFCDPVNGQFRIMAQKSTFASDPNAWNFGAQDQTLPPNSNLFVFKYDKGWKQVRITNVPLGQVVSNWSFPLIDPVSREWRVTYEVSKQDTWLERTNPFPPPPATVWGWFETARGLNHASESKGSFSSKTIFAITPDWYVSSWVQITPGWWRLVGGFDDAIDRNGAVHILYGTVYLPATATQAACSIKYVTNAGVKGGGFTSPTRLDAANVNSKQVANISCNSVMGVIATWDESYSISTGGANTFETANEICSRYYDGKWGKQVKVNTDRADSWGIDVTPLGEQQILFETTKWAQTPNSNPPTYQYYGYEKYFAQSMGGSWSTELVSNLDVDTWNLNILRDGNGRVHALFGGGNEMYASMQVAPSPPTKTYYFAEGNTRDNFHEWLCLQNPGTSDGNATITYMLGTGANIKKSVKVLAHSRKTVDVNADVGPNQDVSAKVVCNRQMVVERPMYFNYNGKWTGGHDVMGSTDVSRTWYFAEGTTRTDFDEYLTFQNPSGRDTKVDITYILGDGSTKKKQETVGKRRRKTIKVWEQVGRNKDVSVKITSGEAIVVERPEYFNYEGKWNGGHNVMGARSLQNRWYFAEGCTSPGFDTYLCMQNPYTYDLNVTVKYIMEKGKTKTTKVLIKKTSRRTVKVNDAPQAGANQNVSIVVDSPSPIVAERPMYFNYNDKWTGGSVTMGAITPKNSWFMAEGNTREWCSEWLCLENPGSAEASVTLSFMLGDGSVVQKVVKVGKHARFTVDVNLLLGKDKDCSVAIWSDKGIIAERPMYFDYQKKWTGGHDVMGL